MTNRDGDKNRMHQSLQMKRHSVVRKNRLLNERLSSLTAVDDDYWSFRGNSKREHGHGLFQYPAMMVPQMVSSILEQVCSVHPEIECIGDPFSGSGTIMTESMMRGLEFVGNDINPLAVLICRVKKGPFLVADLEEKVNALLGAIKSDRRYGIEANFTNLDKWFSFDVQLGLSKIRRAIRREKDLWARRFFWVALAETVRLSSNSRTSTFKLHIRTDDDIQSRVISPTLIFNRILQRNQQHYNSQAERLAAAGHLKNGIYCKYVDVALADIRTHDSVIKSDAIITSPPYGDNTTTVPYGQYSYLPLQWIDCEDIDPNIDPNWYSNSHGIDSRSLGGRRNVLGSDISELCDLSKSFRECIMGLTALPKDRTTRVTSFFRDLNDSIPPILDGLRPGGIMVWTLGNRKVGGLRVPLDRILSELLENNATTVISKLTRNIPSKRMALKNSISDTMSTETILVMRKASKN